MSEISTADQISSILEPACQLRWVARLAGAPLTTGFTRSSDQPHVVMVLQQAWKIIDYRDGQAIGARQEWRDVPTETAA